MNKNRNFSYVNYSVPKDDPIHNAGNDSELYAAIKSQISKSSVVIILAGVYSTYSKWINKEIQIAKEEFVLSKAIFGYFWMEKKKIFISHKQEDEFSARSISAVCRSAGISFYLDVLDDFTSEDAESLTNHIHEKLNDCTDLMVVVSFKTRYSQWVPFEIGMAAQAYMPTASYLSDDVRLPEFLEFWPQLKNSEDVVKCVEW